MTETPERCFRNAVDFTEDITRVINLLTRPKVSKQDADDGLSTIANLQEWLEQSKTYPPEELYTNVVKALEKTVVSPPEILNHATRQRVTDTLYSVRRALRTPYGLTHMDLQSGDIIYQDPWTG